jgi:type IV fimbrial biogenesis protein FimT
MPYPFYSAGMRTDPSRPRIFAAFKRQRGFTLIELMTVLVVAAVLLGVAVPSLSSFIISSRLRSATSEIASSLALARSEAIKRSQQIVVGGLGSTAGEEFTNGWQMWVDADRDGTFNAGDTKLRVGPALPTGYTVTTTPASATVTFKRNGFLAVAAPVTFKVCAASSTTGYTVTLEPSGLTDTSNIAATSSSTGVACP